MNYNNIFLCSNLLQQIPSAMDGKSMPTSLAVDIILLRTAYARKMEEYDNFMKDALKKLKKEGFDDRVKAMQEMEAIDKRLKEHEEWKEGDTKERPTKPTDEEIAKADKTREGKVAYDKELEELDKAYSDARMKKAQEEVKDAPRMSKDTFTQLVDFVGMAGTIDIKDASGNTFTRDRSELLFLIGDNMVG